MKKQSLAIRVAVLCVVALTNLQTQLVAGKYTATTPASTALFDNLKLERND